VVQVQADDAGRALQDAAGAEVMAQGAVGAGTGMMCFGFKGGIGTASRVVPALDATVGVVVLANFGARRQLRIDGVPVGRLLADDPAPQPGPAGSCIVVVATDAPLVGLQLTRLARRAGLGLARTGSVAHHSSGEIFLGFSTTTRQPRALGGASVETLADRELDDLFVAMVDATEEAVLNALWSAERTDGRDGRIAHALPHDDVLALLDAHGRL
jgi:D-aminopeptidase